VTPKYDMTLLE